MLDALGESGSALARFEGVEDIDVGDDKLGLPERADEVFEEFG